MRDTIKKHYSITLLFTWAVFLTLIAVFAGEPGVTAAAGAAFATGAAGFGYFFYKALNL